MILKTTLVSTCVDLLSGEFNLCELSGLVHKLSGSGWVPLCVPFFLEAPYIYIQLKVNLI